MNGSLATRANREYFFFDREQRIYFSIIYFTNRIDSLRRIGCIVRIIIAPQAYTLIINVFHEKKCVICHIKDLRLSPAEISRRLLCLFTSGSTLPTTNNNLVTTLPS